MDSSDSGQDPVIFSYDNELLGSTEVGNLTTSFLRRTFISSTNMGDIWKWWCVQNS